MSVRAIERQLSNVYLELTVSGNAAQVAAAAQLIRAARVAAAAQLIRAALGLA